MSDIFKMVIEVINGKYHVNGRTTDEMSQSELAFLWKFFAEIKNLEPKEIEAVIEKVNTLQPIIED